MKPDQKAKRLFLGHQCSNCFYFNEDAIQYVAPDLPVIWSENIDPESTIPEPKMKHNCGYKSYVLKESVYVFKDDYCEEYK